MKNLEKIKIIEDILEDKSKQRLRESFFKTKYLSIYNNILFFCKNIEDLNFKQKLWHWINNRPDYFMCITCNKEKTTFNKNWKDGYRNFCSQKCSATSNSTKQKRKETCLEIYGVDNVAKNEDIKIKTSETNIELYGVKSTFQNKEVRDKWKKTILDKYGVDHYFKSDEFKITNKKYYYEKWGVYHQSHLLSTQNKIKNTNFERYGVFSYLQTEHTRQSVTHSNTSEPEREIKKFIENVNFIESDKKIIYPLELDIYIPEKKNSNRIQWIILAF